MPKKIRRVALGLEYQGTNYFGLQKQKTTKKTVQGLGPTVEFMLMDR